MIDIVIWTCRRLCGYHFLCHVNFCHSMPKLLKSVPKKGLKWPKMSPISPNSPQKIGLPKVVKTFSLPPSPSKFCWQLFFVTPCPSRLPALSRWSASLSGSCSLGASGHATSRWSTRWSRLWSRGRRSSRSQNCPARFAPWKSIWKMEKKEWKHLWRWVPRWVEGWVELAVVGRDAEHRFDWTKPFLREKYYHYLLLARSSLKLILLI